MRFETFVGHVQNRARLSSQSAALRASRAALETLAERIGSDEAENLASQLPHEIGECLRHPTNAHAGRFDLHDYYSRVAGREGADLPAAAFHSRIVMEVVCEAVSRGEIDDLLSRLPDEYYPLFTHGGATAA